MLALVVAGVVAIFAPPGPAVAATTPCAGGRLVPSSGALFGVSLDHSKEQLPQYARRLGRRPAVTVSFTYLPMTRQQGVFVDQAAKQVRDGGGVLLLTVEPMAGLDRVTDSAARSLAVRLRRYERAGVPTMVRFGHEMNGSWYPWAQKPAPYVAAFRRVAQQVHRLTSSGAMLWAPNYGGGYPFTGGQHQAQAGTPDATALDTDGDGAVTGADDPYAPYYPGDAYVDWVGMTLCHFGNVYPWGENEVPEPGKFAALLTGTYNGLNGDETAVPDFYADWAVAHRKPLAIPETGALYAPGRGGDGQLAIKQGWWKQALAPDLRTRFPRLRLIGWFEQNKFETEIQGRVDWTTTRTPAIRTAFRKALPSWLRYAGAVRLCRRRRS